MFIKDGQLPEDIRARADAQQNTNEIIEADAVDQTEISETEEKFVPDEFDSDYWYNLYGRPDIMDRFKVHMIDTAVFYIIYTAVYYLISPPESFNPGNFILTYLFFVYINAGQLITWIELLVTNGYTVGKKLYGHRVMRVDSKRLTLKDVLVRSLAIKGFCNMASCGILNMFSIAAAYIKPVGKPAHDLAASTITVQLPRGKDKEKEEVRYEFN